MATTTNTPVASSATAIFRKARIDSFPSWQCPEERGPVSRHADGGAVRALEGKGDPDSELGSVGERNCQPQAQVDEVGVDDPPCKSRQPTLDADAEAGLAQFLDDADVEAGTEI